MIATDKPLVTAVITTYKRKPDVVRRALESIIRQSYENIEIYVINDYPIDKALVESLKDMIDEVACSRTVHYVVVDKNGGACKARNLALFNADGKYFACLDDDDEWLPNKIMLQVEKMEKNPDAAIVYCNAIIKNERVKQERVRFSTEQNEGDIYIEMLGKNNIGSCSFPMFRTEIIKMVGGFNNEMPALQDWELYLRILKKARAVYVHEPLAIYYFHEGERISAHPENRTKAFELIYNVIKDDLFKNKKSASAFYLMGTYFYSLAGDMKNAFRYYKLGIADNPLYLTRNIKDFFRLIGRKFIRPKNV